MIVPLEAPGVPPIGALSHGARAGAVVALTGQVAVGAAPGLGAREQAEIVWDRIEEILRAAGAGFDDVVKITTYIVDRADRTDVAGVRNARFAERPLPASTLVVVAGLAEPDWRVEIDVLAVLDRDG